MEILINIAAGMLLGLPVSIIIGAILYFTLKYLSKHPKYTCEDCIYFDDGRGLCWLKSGSPNIMDIYTKADKKACEDIKIRKR